MWNLKKGRHWDEIDPTKVLTPWASPNHCNLLLFFSAWGGGGGVTKSLLTSLVFTRSLFQKKDCSCQNIFATTWVEIFRKSVPLPQTSQYLPLNLYLDFLMNVNLLYTLHINILVFPHGKRIMYTIHCIERGGWNIGSIVVLKWETQYCPVVSSTAVWPHRPELPLLLLLLLVVTHQNYHCCWPEGKAPWSITGT